jgi:hypothetical protein
MYLRWLAFAPFFRHLLSSLIGHMKMVRTLRWRTFHL